MKTVKRLSLSTLALSLSFVSMTFIAGCKAPSPKTSEGETNAVEKSAVETKGDEASIKTEIQGEDSVVQPVMITLADVIADPSRDKDRARDQFRNPLETLEFFEVRPNKSVAEIWPGWYAKILAPYAKSNAGAYTAILLPFGINERYDARIEAFKETYSDIDTYGVVAFAEFDGANISGLEDNSQDVILTFRNVHNWMKNGTEQDAFSAFYTALKPGGILGVVEHRLPESVVQDPKGTSGYVQESYMKALAKEAGFEFVGASEVNANPRDTADHPFGVWTLPPRSRTPEAGDREYADFKPELYKNIGESDRATLKFRKPL